MRCFSLPAVILFLALFNQGCDNAEFNVKVTFDQILEDKADSLLTHVIFHGTVKNSSLTGAGLFEGQAEMDIYNVVLRLNIENPTGVTINGGATYMDEAESRIRYGETVPFLLILTFANQNPPRSFDYVYWVEGDADADPDEEDEHFSSPHIRDFHAF